MFHGLQIMYEVHRGSGKPDEEFWGTECNQLWCSTKLLVPSIYMVYWFEDQNTGKLILAFNATAQLWMHLTKCSDNIPPRKNVKVVPDIYL
jgi:hypothetical protein